MITMLVVVDGGSVARVPVSARRKPYKRAPMRVENLCGVFKSRRESKSMDAVTMDCKKHFGTQRTMFHVDGTVMVNPHHATFMGVHGAAALQRLGRATALGDPVVYMTVVSGKIGHGVDIQEAGLLERNIYRRHRFDVSLCWRTDEMSNSVRFRVNEWRGIFSTDTRPLSNEWNVSGMGTVMGRFTWEGIRWTEEAERAWLAMCDEVLAWLTECCPEGMAVDLKLAVNYVPACTCLLKMIMIFFIILWGDVSVGTPALVVTLAAAIGDRVLSPAHILDTNGVVMGFLGSYLLGKVRHAQRETIPWLVVQCFQGCWCVGCILMIAEPHYLRLAMERSRYLGKLQGFLMLLVYASSLAFVHQVEDPAPVLFCRALSYAGLCVVWTYVVGLRATEDPWEMSIQFTARFSAALLVPPYMATIFVACAGIAIGWHYYQGIPVAPTESKDKDKREPDDLESLQTLLRNAKSRVNPLPTVAESPHEEA